MKKIALMVVLLFTASAGFSAVAVAGKGAAAEVIHAASTTPKGDLFAHTSGAISSPKVNPALAAVTAFKGGGTTGTRGDHDHDHGHGHGHDHDHGHGHGHGDHH
jgi:nickel/cobalt exporter